MQLDTVARAKRDAQEAAAQCLAIQAKLEASEDELKSVTAARDQAEANLEDKVRAKGRAAGCRSSGGRRLAVHVHAGWSAVGRGVGEAVGRPGLESGVAVRPRAKG